MGRGQRNALELRLHGLDDGAVAMAELHRGDAGNSVDVGPALRVGEPHPGPFDDDERILHEGLHLIEVDHQVGQAGMLGTA